MHRPADPRSSGEPERSAIGTAKGAVVVFAGALLTLLAGRYLHTGTRPAHWDELLFLSRIFEYQRGELHVVLQTIHARVFSWIADGTGSEWRALLTGRAAAEAAIVAAAAVIARLGACGGGWFAGCAAALTFLSLPSVVRHGGSFRADPFLVLLIAASALSLSQRTLREGRVGEVGTAVLAGFFFGCAGAISIKASLFLPTLMLWCGPGRRRVPVFIASSALVAGTLLLCHRALDTTPGAALAKRSVSTLFSGFIFTASPDGVGAALVQSLIDAPVQWFFVLSGALLLALRRTPGAALPWWNRARLAGAVAPLAVALLYRNAFDYFMPLAFLFPALIAGAGAELLRRYYGAVPVAVAVCVGIGAGPLRVSEQELQQAARQERMLEVIHRLFPQPVPYFDCCSMVASFPKVGPFMSSWVISRLGEEGVTDVIAGARPVPQFVLVNSPLVDPAAGGPLAADNAKGRPPRALGDADLKLLRERYVAAGKFPLLPGFAGTLAEGEERSFVISISGRYQLLSGSRCRVDGSLQKDDSYVQLAEGEHRAVGIEGGGRCALRLVPPGIESGTVDELLASPLDRGPLLR